MRSRPDQLTLLTTVGARVAVKTFALADEEVTVKGYDKAKRFTREVVEFDDTGETLKRLANKQHSFLVLGAPLNWEVGEKRLRRSHDSEDGEATLADVPRRWMPVDIDHLNFEPLADIQDGECLALECLSMLGIKRTQCVWQLTGSHGIEGKWRG